MSIDIEHVKKLFLEEINNMPKNKLIDKYIILLNELINPNVVLCGPLQKLFKELLIDIINDLDKENLKKHFKSFMDKSISEMPKEQLEKWIGGSK